MSSLTVETANITSLLNAPALTNAQRDALEFSPGSVIYNTDDQVIEAFDGEVWLLLIGTRQGGGSQATTPLYDFTAATFTNGGQTGTTGPSLSQAISGISGNDGWKNNSQYFTVNSGIQFWTVPVTASYSITAAGAQGGQSQCWGPQGGLGATMIGVFSLTKGEILKILVGQQGGSNCYDAGGGGGTFVTKQDNSALVIAAGGGAGSASGFSGNGQHGGRTDNSGSSTSWANGGSSGNGGNGYGNAGGGGGLSTNGTGSWGGQAFVNGGNGGAGTSGAFGGFGGGGGGGQTNGAGGGGGYSGGAAAPWSYYGAGGGSFNSGTSQQNTSANRSGSGYVTITKQ